MDPRVHVDPTANLGLERQLMQETNQISDRIRDKPTHVNCNSRIAWNGCLKYIPDWIGGSVWQHESQHYYFCSNPSLAIALPRSYDRKTTSPSGEVDESQGDVDLLASIMWHIHEVELACLQGFKSA